MPTVIGRLLRWWAAVIGLICVNQVLVVAYIDHQWSGDPARAAVGLPGGWFDLARSGPVHALAALIPDPGVFGWSLFRFQALLELPFVMLGYALVAAYASPRAIRWVLSPAALWLTSLSWTATFCWAEIHFRSSWTDVDLVLRIVTAVLTPVLLGRLTRGAAPLVLMEGVRSLAYALLAGLLVAVVVLEIYDSSLLYNSARLPAALAVSALALLVLADVSRRAASVPYPTASVVVAIRHAYEWLVMIFVIPALPIRYALNFGARWVALVCGVVVVAFAAARALEVVRPRLGSVLVGGALATGIALVVVVALRPLVAHLHTYGEVRLGIDAAIGLIVLVGVAAVYDRCRPERS
ncbi:hypothetical protein Back2_08340 [Nocardioides baekrokdamisoli]|uniref:Uncharacterized protein n=1 Tax=Nocardioides baekrokdamisoli TaxID=1804624 RepID=A0A3G9ICA3_9ACTN|nr:hypothetical protein [Nocardioides baekrokdamisoli]BBH16547.1 hypothetical protein Back2_08340 [Nocardioides baekrokdamisoli]